jgi:hypothetical protein
LNFFWLIPAFILMVALVKFEGHCRKMVENISIATNDRQIIKTDKEPHVHGIHACFEYQDCLKKLEALFTFLPDRLNHCPEVLGRDGMKSRGAWRI